MANSSPRTVCLLGPKASGKSSMLRTMRRCLTLNAHGYQPGHIASFELKEITQQDFEEGLSGPDGRILTRFSAGKYASEEDHVFEREPRSAAGSEAFPKALRGTEEYFFSLEWTPAALQGEVEYADPEQCLLQVVDAAGELWTASGPKDGITEDALERHRAALDEELRNTEGVVLVAPPADGTPEDWAGYILGALEMLAQLPAKYRRLKHIVVVFSQYDRLFARCGKDAVDIAVRQHTVLYAIRREYHARPWLQRLAALHHKVPEIDMRFTVASALGFATLFGNPNLDPNAEGPRSGPSRFRMTTTDGLDAAPLWRPFLTADPFIFAATGLPNAYMFTVDEVADTVDPDELYDEMEYAEPAAWDDRTPSDAEAAGQNGFQADESTPPPPRRTFLRRVKRFFNANKR